MNLVIFKLLTLIILLVLNLFTPNSSYANTAILAFNWGDSIGVEKAIQAVKKDSLETTNGFEIGQNFWKSLFDSQSFADHNAGDGLYFSTQPLDSARFGPSLLIVEIQISDPEDEKILKVMTGEQAQVHPELLPTIVRYRGSWHVVKNLPKDKQVKIWIRKPIKEDVDKIFENFQLETNKAKVLDLITQIGSRYAYHFRRYGKTKDIPNEKSDNHSTQKFINHLIFQLVEQGLTFQSSFVNSADEMNSFSKQLPHTLHNLRQLENEKAVFGFDMTKAIYKKMLSRTIEWPPEIINTLRFYHEEYFTRFSNVSIRPKSCLALF